MQFYNFEFVFSKTYLYIMPMFQYQFHICNTYPIRLQIIEKHFRGSKRIILQLTMVYVKQFEFELKSFSTLK